MQSKNILITDGIGGIAASLIRDLKFDADKTVNCDSLQPLSLESVSTANPNMMETHYRTVRKTPKKKRKEQKASRRKNRK